MTDRNAFQHYEAVRALREGDYVRTVRVVDNGYSGPKVIAADRLVRIDFTYREGLYGRAEGPGNSTFRCQIDANDFHKLEIVSSE